MEVAVASAGKALPSVTHLNSVDDAGKWFWGFLKTELAPYPGRAWVVGRVTISATLVMLVVMTFQIPNGFLGAIFTLFISRENPTATFVSGLKAIAAFMLATIYTLIGVAMFVDDPLTHFLGVGVSLFVSFFLISITNDYGTAVAFGFTIAGAIPLWDRNTLNINDRVIGHTMVRRRGRDRHRGTIVVEYVFRRVHPATDLTEGIEAPSADRGDGFAQRSGRAASGQRFGKESYPVFQCRYLKVAKADPPLSIQPAFQVSIGHGGCSVRTIGGRSRQFPTVSRRAREDGGDR